MRMTFILITLFVIVFIVGCDDNNNPTPKNPAFNPHHRLKDMIGNGVKTVMIPIKRKDLILQSVDTIQKNAMSYQVLKVWKSNVYRKCYVKVLYVNDTARVIKIISKSYSTDIHLSGQMSNRLELISLELDKRQWDEEVTSKFSLIGKIEPPYRIFRLQDDDGKIRCAYDTERYKPTPKKSRVNGAKFENTNPKPLERGKL